MKPTRLRVVKAVPSPASEALAIAEAAARPSVAPTTMQKWLGKSAEPAPSWSDEQVGQLLYIVSALGPRDPQGANFWQAVEAFGDYGGTGERRRLQREAAKAYALLERRAGAEVRRLRRQLEGVRSGR